MERNKGFAVQTKNADSNERSKSLMKPYGVWAVISPFNFPFAILAGMSIAVIVTGNTVVLKPASDTPIIGSLFVEIMKKAGLPDGGTKPCDRFWRKDRKSNCCKSRCCGYCVYRFQNGGTQNYGRFQ